MSAHLGLGSDAPGSSTHVSLLGEFRLLVRGTPVACHPAAQQLLACLGIAGQPLDRRTVAVTIWPDVPVVRGLARVRAAAWDLRQGAAELLVAEPRTIGLHPRVVVDVAAAWEWARCLLDQEGGPAALPVAWGGPRDLLGSAEPVGGLALLTRDLLETWDDPWVLTARERFRQVRLHALESLARHLLERGRFSAAVEAVMTVLSADEFRESSHRLLIEVHLAEGNRVDGLRQYDRYVQMMTELGLPPSDDIRALVHGATGLRESR